MEIENKRIKTSQGGSHIPTEIIWIILSNAIRSGRDYRKFSMVSTTWRDISEEIVKGKGLRLDLEQLLLTLLKRRRVFGFKLYNYEYEHGTSKRKCFQKIFKCVDRRSNTLKPSLCVGKSKTNHFDVWIKSYAEWIQEQRDLEYEDVGEWKYSSRYNKFFGSMDMLKVDFDDIAYEMSINTWIVIYLHALETSNPKHEDFPILDLWEEGKYKKNASIRCSFRTSELESILRNPDFMNKLYRIN